MTHLRDAIHREPPQMTAESWRKLTIYAHEQDHTGRLPAPALAKLKKLREAADIATVLSKTSYDNYQDARRKCGDIRARISQLERDEDPAAKALIAAEREMLAAYASKAEENLAEHTQRSNVKDAWRELVKRVESYCAQFRGDSQLEMAHHVQSRMGKSQTAADLVDHIRLEIEAAKAGLQAAIDAPVHSSEAKRIARAQIEQLAVTGRPNVLVTLEGRRAPLFAKTHKMLSPGDDIIDTPATLAWVFKDELIAAMEREIDAHADDASALTDDERAKRVADLMAAILELERQEESVIENAASEGANILRRPDADPRAVLGLASAAPAPKCD